MAPNVLPNNSPALDPFLLFLFATAGLRVYLQYVQLIVAADEEEQFDITTVANSALAIHRRQGRRKRRCFNWNWERARRAVIEDYYGPTPRFNDRQFERVFRVTREITNRLLTICQASDSFFREREDATGRRPICPKVKILMGLKLLAYGVSPSAFQDYLQMGETTARLCMKKLCFAIFNSNEVKDIFLRDMNRADAMKVAQLHLDQHGVDGMIGSLDCMHIYWKNCPVGWQGQFSGAKEAPTIVLEAFADYNLWIWHASFGWAGTNNDINILDRSPLLKSFLDGSFNKDVDFGFKINNQPFDKVWLMVDGIYPNLSRFVKTLQEPGNLKAKKYSSWQEASRKDVERAFGVIQRKFAVLTRPIEFWYNDDIYNVVMTTIILHNMMVAHRMTTEERENNEWYETQEDELDEHAVADVAQEYVEIYALKFYNSHWYRTTTRQYTT